MCSSNQQDDYYDACDNVYEDVENINRYLGRQNSRKLKEHKGGPKSKKRFHSSMLDLLFYLFWIVFISHYEII